MPFTMVHLSIAYKILQLNKEIRNHGDFLLGSVAPDAVHSRSHYRSDMKKLSHLCVGDEAWGRMTNNSEWLVNVLNFLRENGHGVNRDFILGYGAHIIADIQNNIKIWTPFRIAQEGAIFNQGGSQYHQESDAVDAVQYLRHENLNEIKSLLTESWAVGLEGLVTMDEVDALRDNLLHKKYVNCVDMDLAHHAYVTLERADSFIKDEAEYIYEMLKDF